MALEWGLIVPVVRRPKAAQLRDLARAIADLALAPAPRSFRPTRSGIHLHAHQLRSLWRRVWYADHRPSPAILAVGGLRKEPAVLTDAEGNDPFAVRSMQYFCLGFDHRLIDGADGGKFMLEFKKQLKLWSQEIG